ncbi:hypothetical protein ABW19_dt0210635 [Dactylella cylindrospora]|nr:hypothetical protein ABW19_dt0210635 [Dactylella cylindrospora]
MAAAKRVASITELLLQILYDLPPVTLITTARLVCREWKRLVETDEVFQWIVWYYSPTLSASSPANSNTLNSMTPNTSPPGALSHLYRNRHCVSPPFRTTNGMNQNIHKCKSHAFTDTYELSPLELHFLSQTFKYMLKLNHANTIPQIFQTQRFAKQFIARQTEKIYGRYRYFDTRTRRYISARGRDTQVREGDGGAIELIRPCKIATKVYVMAKDWRGHYLDCRGVQIGLGEGSQTGRDSSVGAGLSGAPAQGLVAGRLVSTVLELDDLVKSLLEQKKYIDSFAPGDGGDDSFDEETFSEEPEEEKYSKPKQKPLKPEDKLFTVEAYILGEKVLKRGSEIHNPNFTPMLATWRMVNGKAVLQSSTYESRAGVDDTKITIKLSLVEPFEVVEVTSRRMEVRDDVRFNEHLRKFNARRGRSGDLDLEVSKLEISGVLRF